MATIAISGRFGLNAIESFLKDVSSLSAKRGKIELLEIDLRGLNFITPTGAAALGSWLLYLARKGGFKKGAIIPPLSNEVNKYLSRMDFYKLLKVKNDELFRRHPRGGRFLELIEVQSEEESRNTVQEIMRILESKMTIHEGIARTLQYSISEIIENVFHHAKSDINAIVCAQAYPKRHRIEVAIVDCGVGILRSLRNNKALRERLTDDKSALELAIKSEVTGKPGKNAGEGLFFTHQLIRANKGIMKIISGEGCLEEQGGKYWTRKISHCKGTIVVLELNTKVTIMPKEVFDRFAPPEKDFKIIKLE